MLLTTTMWRNRLIEASHRMMKACLALATTLARNFRYWANGNRTSLDVSERWFVLLDGQPVAMIGNPKWAEMFWLAWDVHEISGNSVPPDLWDCATDKRRSFQHVDTGEMDPLAFPAPRPLRERG
jgi:hypothetical protein